MNPENRDSIKFGKLFGRTPLGQEQVPQAWGEMLSDIYIFATTCNALMLLSGVNGSGKTTFSKVLQDRKPSTLDIVSVTQAGADPQKNWLIDAITPWITSNKDSNHSVVDKIRSLSEIDRPILICIDTPSLNVTSSITPEILSLLNLADGSNLKLSVLVLGSNDLTISISNDTQISSRIVLNASIPSLDKFSIHNFVMSKIKIAGITSENLSAERAHEISLESEGIPGRAIQLIANAMGFVSKKTNDKESSTGALITKKQANHAGETKKTHKIEDLLAPPKR